MVERGTHFFTGARTKLQTRIIHGLYLFNDCWCMFHLFSPLSTVSFFCVRRVFGVSFHCLRYWLILRTAHQRTAPQKGTNANSRCGAILRDTRRHTVKGVTEAEDKTKGGHNLDTPPSHHRRRPSLALLDPRCCLKVRYPNESRLLLHYANAQ